MTLSKDTLDFSVYTIVNADNFPIDDCITTSNENNILESEQWYECVVLHCQRPHGGYEIHMLRPYVYKGKTNGKDKTGYGWISHDNSILYDICRSIMIIMR